MKKSIIGFLLPALFLTGCADGTGDSVGTGIIEPGIYVSGECWDNTYQAHAGYWYNGDWTALPVTDRSFESYTHEIKAFENDLYITGCRFNDEFGSSSTPGYWKSGNWFSLPFPDGSTSGEAISLSSYDSSVYILGNCINDDTSSNIPGYWQDGLWNELPVKDSDNEAFATDMYISDGDVYIGGYFVSYSTDISLNFPGYWKNSVWVDLTPEYAGEDAEVVSMLISGDKVYALGFCCTEGNTGEKRAGYWINGVWQELSSDYADLGDLTLWGDTIYVGGISHVGGEEIPGYWKNGEWVSLAALNTSCYSEVYAIHVNASDIYLCGYTCADVEVPTPCYWFNGTRYDLDLPEDAIEGWTRDFCIVE